MEERISGDPKSLNFLFPFQFFFRHELLQQYRYYWRIEYGFPLCISPSALLKRARFARPGVDYFCDMNEDPFVFLRDHDKVYGFVISMYEFERTIPTLWQTTKGPHDPFPFLPAC